MAKKGRARQRQGKARHANATHGDGMEMHRFELHGEGITSSWLGIARRHHGDGYAWQAAAQLGGGKSLHSVVRAKLRRARHGGEKAVQGVAMKAPPPAVMAVWTFWARAASRRQGDARVRNGFAWRSQGAGLRGLRPPFSSAFVTVD